MSEDIIERLKTELGETEMATSSSPSFLRDLIKDAIAEIEFLRMHAGAVTRGDSFDDILRKTGPQKRGEAS